MTNPIPQWLECLPGRFLVFDGPDGSGKTTQYARFVDVVRSAGIELCKIREPGGTEIGEQIRQILLNPEHDQIDICCEMLLYMASRAQLVAEQIRPALADRKLVLADRFISSTLAYQGSAGGIPLADIRRLGQIVLGDCWPDQVVIFDVDEQIAAQRLAGKTKRTKHISLVEPTLFSDRIELKGLQFHRAVRRGYLDQAKADPRKYLVIDATADPDTVFERLTTSLAGRLCEP